MTRTEALVEYVQAVIGARAAVDGLREAERRLRQLREEDSFHLPAAVRLSSGTLWIVEYNYMGRTGHGGYFHVTVAATEVYDDNND